jgi:tetratricopeptide (TPR) repeat protein
MNAKDRVLRLLKTLDKTRGAGRHLKPSDVDARLGRHRGYLSRVCSGRIVLHVDRLFEILEVLDVAPEVFATRAIGTPATVDAEHLLELVERQGADRGPALLERIEHGIADETTTTATTTATATTADELRRRLRELDALRFNDALRAEEQLPPVLGQAAAGAAADPGEESRELLCRALGTAGSIYQIRARWSAAARCFRLGLRRARGHSSELLLRGDLLQRSAYLLGDDGEHDIAANVALEAVELFLLAGDEQAVGKALVTRGTLLVDAGQQRRGIDTFDAALRYLPEDAWQYRVASFHGLSFAHFQLGEMEAAADHIRSAIESFRSKTGHSWAKVLWFDGEIAWRRRDHHAAERALRAAYQLFADNGDPLDAVLVSVRLAMILLHGNRPAELRQVAACMMKWSTALRRNRLARAAVDEFILGVLRDEMSPALVDKIERQIREAGAPGWGHPFRA